MTPVEEQKHLASLLNREACIQHQVTIVIGRAASVFKKMLTNTPYFTITKAAEVRDFLDKFSKPMETPLIFEDMSLMTSTVQSYLLKFIEEPPMPLVILASKDNVSPIILSRCKRIIKLPCTDTPGTTALGSFVESRLQMAEEIRTSQRLGEQASTSLLESYNNVEDASLKECPEYMYRMTKLKQCKSNIYNPDRYLKLM